jgi:HlyD family secretion protein
MDRKITKKKWSVQKIISIAVGIGFVILLLLLQFVGSSGTQLKIDESRISIAQIKESEFLEYIPITGRVQPKTTVYLDLEEGGIVEHINIQGGAPVKKGDLILTFTNATAQQRNIDSESRQLDTLNLLRTQKFNLTQQDLQRKEQLLDLNKELDDAKHRFEQMEQLRSSNVVSKDEIRMAKENYEYLMDKNELLKERIRRENRLREQQEQSIDESIERTINSLKTLSKIMDSLQLRAPIDGQLSSMNAEVGQSFARGQRIGQVDQLDGFKVRADIDQFYISRVSEGQTGTFEFNGQTYQLKINKIFPEVVNNVFQADMEFVDELAEGIKRGQSLQIELNLSESSKAKMVAKGGFYRHTSGRWVYKISKDGLMATRVPIVPGRQNPQSFEILEGLDVGDWIITSGYDTYNDVDSLKFAEPIKPLNVALSKAEH